MFLYSFVFFFVFPDADSRGLYLRRTSGWVVFSRVLRVGGLQSRKAWESVGKRVGTGLVRAAAREERQHARVRAGLAEVGHHGQQERARLARARLRAAHHVARAEREGHRVLLHGRGARVAHEPHVAREERRQPAAQ